MTKNSVAAITADLAVGDEVVAVFKESTFITAMTERGPMTTLGKLKGVFRRYDAENGVLTLDDIDDAGQPVRWHFDVEDLCVLMTRGSVVAARSKLS